MSIVLSLSSIPDANTFDTYVSAVHSADSFADKFRDLLAPHTKSIRNGGFTLDWTDPYSHMYSLGGSKIFWIEADSVEDFASAVTLMIDKRNTVAGYSALSIPYKFWESLYNMALDFRTICAGIPDLENALLETEERDCENDWITIDYGRSRLFMRRPGYVTDNAMESLAIASDGCTNYLYDSATLSDYLGVSLTPGLVLVCEC